MEKEENIIEPVVNTIVDDNVTIDDNTELDSSEYNPEITDAPVEDPTLATTDEIIPAPVDIPGEEPIVDPVVDIDNPPMDPVIPEDPAALSPAEPVDVPVENPIDDIVGPGPEPVASADNGDSCACGDACCDDSCGVGHCNKLANITIANYFGTLQESITIAWRFHLKTKIYRVHVALNDFYEKALDIVDDIIEQYQGICGVIEDTFVNCIVGDGKSEGEYLTELKAFVENNRCVVGEHSEINSTIDEFLALIDSTLYKLTSFTENAVKSFDEFVYEDFNESCCHNGYEKDKYGLEEPEEDDVNEEE